jgi:hypothetical protein
MTLCARNVDWRLDDSSIAPTPARVFVGRRDDHPRVSLPKDVLRQIDRHLAPGQSRAMFVERAIVERLARLAEFAE